MGIIKKKGLLFISVLFLIFGCNQGEHKLTVGYLQIAPDPVLDIARDAVFAALKDSGYVNGENFELLEKNAQGDLSMIPMIIQGFESRGVDIIITNGTPCMLAAAQMVKDIPVVFTVSFGPEAVGLKVIPDNLYGVYDPLNEKEYVDLLFKLIPNLKKVGIPYNNSEANAEYSSGKFGTELEKRGVEVIKTSVTSPNDIIMAGQYLAGQRVDAMLVAADNTLNLGLNALAKVANEYHIPLFVTDPMQVQKGAAVGFGAGYQEWGYLAGLKAIKILRGLQFSENEKIESIQKTDLIINKDAAAKQRLSIPDSLSRYILSY